MDLGLTGDRVFIAGSTRGIGRAIAAALLAEGASVAVSGRDGARLELAFTELDAEAPGRVLACHGDLGDPVVLARAVRLVEEHWHGLDGVVSNIGTGSGLRGWDMDVGEWHQLFHQNLFVSAQVARAMIPIMMRGGRGSVVFVSSIAGIEALDTPIAYAAAKAGLIALMKMMSRQVGEAGIRVNAVAPGNVLATGGTWDVRRREDRLTTERYVRDHVPMQRFGLPEEIADAVVFLASKRASFVNGACLIVDGGQSRAFF